MLIQNHSWESMSCLFNDRDFLKTSQRSGLRRNSVWDNAVSPHDMVKTLVPIAGSHDSWCWWMSIPQSWDNRLLTHPHSVTLYSQNCWIYPHLPCLLFCVSNPGDGLLQSSLTYLNRSTFKKERNRFKMGDQHIVWRHRKSSKFHISWMKRPRHQGTSASSFLFSAAFASARATATDAWNLWRPKTVSTPLENPWTKWRFGWKNHRK